MQSQNMVRLGRLAAEPSDFRRIPAADPDDGCIQLIVLAAFRSVREPEVFLVNRTQHRSRSPSDNFVFESLLRSSFRRSLLLASGHRGTRSGVLFATSAVCCANPVLTIH